jgi:hypothetical protein
MPCDAKENSYRGWRWRRRGGRRGHHGGWWTPPWTWSRRTSAGGVEGARQCCEGQTKLQRVLFHLCSSMDATRAHHPRISTTLHPAYKTAFRCKQNTDHSSGVPPLILCKGDISPLVLRRTTFLSPRLLSPHPPVMGHLGSGLWPVGLSNQLSVRFRQPSSCVAAIRGSRHAVSASTSRGICTHDPASIPSRYPAPAAARVIA